MDILKNDTAAAKTSESFKMLSGQSLTLSFSATGSVDVQYKASDNWVLLVTLAANARTVADGNMIVRLVITANTGEIDAEIL